MGYSRIQRDGGKKRRIRQTRDKKVIRIHKRWENHAFMGSSIHFPGATFVETQQYAPEYSEAYRAGFSKMPYSCDYKMKLLCNGMHYKKRKMGDFENGPSEWCPNVLALSRADTLLEAFVGRGLCKPLFRYACFMQCEICQNRGGKKKEINIF